MANSAVNNNTKVFTVIVTYNGLQLIKHCLDSVYTTTTIIVVDNASSDDTVSYIAKNYSDIIILEQDQNLGFGRANNLGISYALNSGADYLLLLNQDAKMKDNAVHALVNFSKHNKPSFCLILCIIPRALIDEIFGVNEKKLSKTFKPGGFTSFTYLNGYFLIEVIFRISHS